MAVLGAGATQDGSIGPAIEAQLRYRAREFTLSASYQRTFVPSFGFGGTFQNEEWVGSMYVESSVAWFDNDPIVNGQPSLQSTWLSGTGGYRAAQWMNVEIYAHRAAQDTQSPGGNVKRTEIGFRMVITKPMRLRSTV